MAERTVRGWLADPRPPVVAAAVAPVVAGSAVAIHEFGFNGLPALALVVVCALAAAAYLALVRGRGFGAADAVWFGAAAFGVTCLSAYVQERMLSPLTFAVALAMACLSAAVIGFAALSRAGAAPTLRWLVVGLIVAAFEVPVIAAVANLAPLSALLPLLAIPVGIVIGRRTLERSERSLEGDVTLTAMLELAFALLWSAGMLLLAS